MPLVEGAGELAEIAVQFGEVESLAAVVTADGRLAELTALISAPRSGSGAVDTAVGVLVERWAAQAVALSEVSVAFGDGLAAAAASYRLVEQAAEVALERSR